MQNLLGLLSQFSDMCLPRGNPTPESLVFRRAQFFQKDKQLELVRQQNHHALLNVWE